MSDLLLARYLVLGSVAIYFIFEYFDGRVMKDEREELIRLKTFELMQRLTAWTLIAIAIILVFLPAIPAIYPVMALVLSAMYGEIFGKLYFRKKY
jgi:hypothetical protein